MLSEAQVQEYLNRIGMPNTNLSNIQPNKDTLDKLIYAHQTHIPFETLGVHRANQTPTLSIDSLFKKVITEQKGGYCFELNKLFQELLEALGFDASPVLSRAVRGRDSRMPINHRGILVRIGEDLYSSDVGFGGPMPAGALKLEEELEQEIEGEIYIPSKNGQSWWKIDRRTKAAQDLHDDNLPERRQTELEICESPVEDIDFDSLNLFCAQPGTLFRDHDVVNLRTPNGYKGYKDGVLTIRENGNKEIIELTSEEDINKALAQHFNLIYD